MAPESQAKTESGDEYGPLAYMSDDAKTFISDRVVATHRAAEMVALAKDHERPHHLPGVSGHRAFFDTIARYVGIDNQTFSVVDSHDVNRFGDSLAPTCAPVDPDKVNPVPDIERGMKIVTLAVDVSDLEKASRFARLLDEHGDYIEWGSGHKRGIVWVAPSTDLVSHETLSDVFDTDD